ncbi:YceD family protein [Alicyclobacillus macrosporangiidus]|uniref:YceD family protein n=1 Tax=Alicyclobacillus macrosporangiidus TaxID=392015 RepID=UPI000498297E|nr:DUF177 domain-containing protein [Alicyclobacillus macrosporangiidus]MCL6598808.1 DUF177 domain-containing protein [Alicyclobacillus macrosporangiidus]
MELHVTDLRQAGRPVKLHEDVELPRIVEENPQVAGMDPVHCDLEAEAAQHTSHVHGLLSTRVTYDCSRCLEPFVRGLTTRFDELFTDNPDEVDEDHHLSGDTIELDPYIEQAINLELDVYPVCSEACKGLCPVCGANLNLGECGCDRRPVDPRLDVLKDLFSDDGSK